MKNTKTKKKSKIAKAIGALVLSAIMLAGGGAVGYGAATDWKYKKGGVQAEMPSDTGPSEINTSANSMQLSSGENRGARFKTRALRVSEYEEYEIDTQNVDSVHVATVTLVNHDEATDKSITLSAEFTSDWAVKNLNVSDYIMFSSTTVQSGEQFTISCLQAFAYPITIKATANGSVSANDGSKAYCTIRADYVHRYQGIGICILDDYDDVEKSWWLTTTGGKIEFFVDEAIHADKLCIGTSCDDPDDWSAGTIFENVTNVKISWTDGHPLQDWDDALTLKDDIPNFGLFDESLLCTTTNVYGTFVRKLNDDCKYYAGEKYSTILNNYNKKVTTSRLWVQFTGELTGITYTFYADILVNPQYMYVPAGNPSFDPDTSGGIIF